MQLSKGTLLALTLLPSLGMARLRPHVKRQTSLFERALDSSGLDDCQGTLPAQTSPTTHHQHKTLKQTTPSFQGEHSTEQEKGTPPYNPLVGKGKPVIISKGNAPAKGGLLEANTLHPGFLIGSAVRSSQLDGSMDKCINANLNMLVPEYEAKSDKVEPQRNEWVTSPVDTIVAYTKKHDIKLKIHTLFFDQTMAGYFQTLNKNPEGLKAAMKEHIDGMMKLYGSDSVMVDVVNEVMSYSGDGSMKKDIFYETLGDEYLPFAFDTAKAANPHPLLFLNDNDIESVHSKGLPSKYSGMLRVLKSLIAKGVRVDGLSMQGHFTTGQVPKDLAAVIKSFIDLGLRVFISELDIVNPDGQDAQQADDYAFAFDACLKNYPGCMGVNMWGLNDRVNWNGESSKATMFDGDCNIKEGIAEGVKAVLNGTETF